MAAGIVVARELGASGRGTLSVLVALGTLSVLLGSFGIHYSGIYFIGRRPNEVDRILSNLLAVSVVGGLATAAVLTLGATLAHSALLGTISFHLYLLFVAVVPCSYFSEFARRALMGFGKAMAYVVADLFEGPILLAGTVASILVFGPRIAPLVVLRVAVAAVQAVVLATYLLRSRRFRFAPDRQLLKEQVAYGLRNYAGSLLWLFLLRSDLVLCNHFLGRARTGVYSVAESLALPLSLVVATMSVLLFQRTSSQLDRAQRIANTNRLLRMVAPVLVACGTAMALLSHVLVVGLYGSPYAAAAPALVLLVPGVVLVSIETLLASHLAGEGAPLVVVWAPLVGAVINLGANLYVIPRFGIDGAAVTSSVGYAVTFTLVALYYVRLPRSSGPASRRAGPGSDGALAPE